MGCFKKLKKLLFWTKKEKREKEGEGTSENVVTNVVQHIEEETENQVEWRNEALQTNFLPHTEEEGANKRQNTSEDVGTKLLEHTEEDVEIQEEERVKKRNCSYENVLGILDETLEHIEPNTMEEMKTKNKTTENHNQEVETPRKSQRKLQRKLQKEINTSIAERRDRQRVEKALRRQVMELEDKVARVESNRVKMEDTLTFHIKLQRNLKEQMAKKNYTN